MHLARALSNKINNDREDGRCSSFAWIYWTILDIRWPLHFFPETDLFTMIYTLFKNEQKPSVEKFQDFCLRDIKPAILRPQGAWNYGR